MNGGGGGCGGGGDGGGGDGGDGGGGGVGGGGVAVVALVFTVDLRLWLTLAVFPFLLWK
jgi:hypothetical protein